MLKHSLRFLLIAVSLLVGSRVSYSQMSDQAVIAYAKEARAQGKDKNTIASELLAKGVTREQAERIQRTLFSGSEDGDGGGGNVTSITAVDTPMRTEGNAQRADAHYEGVSSHGIFGHDVFTNKNLSFEPNQNMATPPDYRLGPGDSVSINIFGESEDNITATISPEGSIILSQIGPVYLNGLTVEEANKRLRRIFAQRYAGFDNNQSDVNLTLGDVRSIMVNVMGEVSVPGTYRMSPFSSVFSALYNSGGVTGIGSIRDVNVIRDGKKIASIDIYDYLFNGKTSENIRLQEGDVIIVPPAQHVVTASGEVKRPMSYEMLPEETLSDLIRFAGGFTGSASTGNLIVSRYNGVDKDVMNVTTGDFDTFTLRDGDRISISPTNGRVQNSVQISGSVLRPGQYALDSQINTITDLINVADGLEEDAFTTRAILYRLDDNREREILSIDLEGILNGTVPDVKLRRDDNLVIYNLGRIIDYGDITISGMVDAPGRYQYAADLTLDDLILMAGGLKQGASLSRVDVYRRVIDPYSLTPTEEIAKLYQFPIKDDYVINNDSAFHLEPYDVVEIRRSPGYEPQQFVSITGEVVFPGSYALQTRTERLSDLVRRSGGVTPSAYVGGASLRRRTTSEENLARQEMVRLAQNRRNDEDSISVAMLDLSSVYTIGINLQKAIENPGSTYDVVLKPGDVLNVPELISTVSISGDVMYPNTVTHIPGKNFKYYVDQAGGFGKEARKKKCYVVYMNGEVAIAKGSTKIEPGCQIIVPTKGGSDATDWAKVMTISSMSGSLATMVATLVSVILR